MRAEVQATEELQQDALQSSAFLLSFFRSACCMGEEHPCLAQTLAACIGDYAAWFGRCRAPFATVTAMQAWIISYGMMGPTLLAAPYTIDVKLVAACFIFLLSRGYFSGPFLHKELMGDEHLQVPRSPI